jgi:nucleoside-diphosphate-sugar epimerase
MKAIGSVLEPSAAASSRGPILVTGANGFIGVKVVETLLGQGFSNLRCFVRPSSRLGRLEKAICGFASGKAVEFVRGDLVSREDCARAARNVSIIYHLAAGVDKSFAAAFMNSALATRNLIEAVIEHGRPERFVNVSSFAVYSRLQSKQNALVDESCALEDAPQARHDAYGFGKLKQEQLVQEYGRTRGLPYVILRLGTVFGPGKKELSGRVGVGTFGLFVQVGGSNLLPLTFVDNCADAIVLAGLKPGVDGEIFNVVDDDLLSSRQFLKAYRKHIGRFRSIRVPYAVAYAFCRAWEEYSVRSGGQLPPAFNTRRCAAEWKRARFSNEKIRRRLGWTPRVGIEEAMARFLGQFDREDS